MIARKARSVIPDLNELAVVLEEEIAVGDELRHNLTAQCQALIAWDIETLITTIEARETWIRSLRELEARRISLVDAQEVPVTLNHLILVCREDLSTCQRLQSVRARAARTFSRLQADERALKSLMGNMQSHLQHALKPLACSSVPLYGDTGMAEPQNPSSALIRSKA